ncbi:hypothetical protein [Roseiarcus sp.]|uniref:hypothetical protein n=1 Tax=Roseiarcus sp. TaxID=1969460 RepID=UPI003F9C3F35
MFKAAITAIGAVLLTGSANAAQISVSVYANGAFTDTGSSITFFGPPVTRTTLSTSAKGFYIEWDGRTDEIPAQWRSVQILKPLPNFGGSVTFAADLKGQLNVARTGAYTLTFGADDGGYLFIDGTHVASTPWAHGIYTVTPAVTLTAGVHKVEVQFDNTVCCRAITALSLPEGVSLGTERTAAAQR